MEEKKNGWQDGADAPITRIKPGKGKKPSSASQMEALKKCAEMAADEIIDMLKDKSQFMRHVFQEKSSGEIREAELKTRNVRHLRDVISAIRELTDVVRGLYGLLPPEAESERCMTLKKLEIEEKKIAPPDKPGQETGVVLLPQPEDGNA